MTNQIVSTHVASGNIKYNWNICTYCYLSKAFLKMFPEFQILQIKIDASELSERDLTKNQM